LRKEDIFRNLIYLLKSHSLYLLLDLDLGLAATPKLLPEIVKRLRAMTPMVTFFNRGLAPRDRSRDFLF
jgi:hypothetical protein